MKRDTNDCFSITAFSYNNNGENYSPRDARSVELANFHWKLVQRYEVFPKVPNILEEKSSFLRYFQTFRPFLSLFPFYLLLLQLINNKNTYACR